MIDPELIKSGWRNPKGGLMRKSDFDGAGRDIMARFGRKLAAVE
jgi:hypothetical protein